MVAMLLGPASCADPQTPAATPEADRPRRPEPPDRPVISLNGLASAEDASPAGEEPPAAGARDPVPGTGPAGACPPGACPTVGCQTDEPPLPVDDPVQLPDCDGAPDGVCVPAGAVSSEEGDGAAGLAGSAVPGEAGAGDGAGSV